MMPIIRWSENGRPQEKSPDHPQAELGMSHIWPELGLNPQRWEWFRALKISDLNHLAMVAAKDILN